MTARMLLVCAGLAAASCSTTRRLVTTEAYPTGICESLQGVAKAEKIYVGEGKCAQVAPEPATGIAFEPHRGKRLRVVIVDKRSPGRGETAKSGLDELEAFARGLISRAVMRMHAKNDNQVSLQSYAPSKTTPLSTLRPSSSAAAGSGSRAARVAAVALPPAREEANATVREAATMAKNRYELSAPAGVERPDQAGIRRVAIPMLAPDSLDEETARALTEIMLAESSTVRGLTVVSPSDFNAVLGLERQKDLLGCQEDLVCVAEIAGALGVDGMLIASVSAVGEVYIVTFKIVDVGRVRVLLRSKAKAKGGTEVLIEVFEEAVPAILGRLVP